MGQIVKRSTHLADGRELIYFDDADTTSGRIAPSTRAPWTRVPPLRRCGRTCSPANGSRSPPPGRTGCSCRRPTAIRSLPRPPTTRRRCRPSTTWPCSRTAPRRSAPLSPTRRTPPSGWTTWPSSGFGRTRTSVGRCEVVCFSPEHEGSFGTQTPSRARTVIEAWADRTAALSALPGIEQVFPFENRGEAIGVTLHHPHGQIYAYPYITPRTLATLLLDRTRCARPVRPHPGIRAGERAGRPGRRALDRLRALRRALADRGAPAAPPPGSRLRRHDRRRTRRTRVPLPAAAARHRRDLRQPPPRTSRRGTRRRCTADATTFRLHLQLTSPRRAADKLKYLAGSEAAMGAWVGDVPPEVAAVNIRKAIERA